MDQKVQLKGKSKSITGRKSFHFIKILTWKNLSKQYMKLRNYKRKVYINWTLSKFKVLYSMKNISRVKRKRTF